MLLRRLLPALLVTLGIAAGAQDVSIVPEIPPLPVDTLPAPPVVDPLPPALPSGPPAGTPRPAKVPVALPDVKANLFVPRTVTGPLRLTFTVRSARAAAIIFGVRRDNAQNCALAPLLRVVRVGTQEVVYPKAGASPRICTQEVITKSTAASGNVSFSRMLDLPAGEYMLESWLTGLADGVLVKVSAPAVRVSVR